MKRLLILPLLLLFSFQPANGPLTDAERNAAIASLQETRVLVMDAAKTLTAEQLNFKPSPEQWSVAECLKHIAVTEAGLRMMLDGTVKAAPNPELRSEIKMTDEQVLVNIASREHKVKTAPMLEPQNSGFPDVASALKAFGEKRDALIEYVKTTPDDLRSHVAKLQFGYLDTYQLVLMMSAHSKRHVAQINEVKADPKFPK